MPDQDFGGLSSRSRWGVAVGSLIGLVAGNAAIALQSFGVLMKPMEEAYGWNRAELSAAPALAAVVSALSIPFLGAAMDRWGVRRVMIPAIVAFAVLLMAAGTARSLLVFTSLIAVAGVFGAAQSPPGYMKCVAAYFDRDRALAMGIAASGVGIGQAIVPPYLNLVIAQFGVAFAFPALGLAVLVIALPPMIFLIKDPPETASLGSAPAATQATGRTLAEALRTRAFWLLAAAIALVSTALNGALVHAVPLLTDQGFSAGAAATMMGAAGVATIVGRVGAGLLADRLFAPMIGAASFLLGLVGLALLGSATAPLAAMILLGVASGSEINLMGYLASRYFGGREYGRIYGLLFALFALGAAAGPLMMGLAFNRDHSYAAPLGLFEVLMAIAAVLIISLGRYPSNSVSGAR